MTMKKHQLESVTVETCIEKIRLKLVYTKRTPSTRYLLGHDDKHTRARKPTDVTSSTRARIKAEPMTETPTRENNRNIPHTCIYKSTALTPRKAPTVAKTKQRG